VHFAAHRRLDDEAVRVALDLPSRPRGASARDLLGLGFTRGTVNPFAHLNTGSVVHVFDADSLAATHADDPGMMTNAGEQTWAVRFSLRRFADAAVEHSGGRAWIVPGLAPEPALSSSMS
jgi:hypothetical protein